jgi:hypothetical protein
MGRVAFFTRIAGVWQRSGTIDRVNSVPTSRFGRRVALGRDGALIGSPHPYRAVCAGCT